MDFYSFHNFLNISQYAFICSQICLKASRIAERQNITFVARPRICQSNTETGSKMTRGQRKKPKLKFKCDREEHFYRQRRPQFGAFEMTIYWLWLLLILLIQLLVRDVFFQCTAPIRVFCCCIVSNPNQRRHSRNYPNSEIKRIIESNDLRNDQ